MVGVLLGQGCQYLGSMNEEVKKLICVHMPQLIPTQLELDISLTMQSAACFAAGLLYLQSRNKIISELLLSSLAREPLNDKDTEREGMALASGIALGFVNLGLRNSYLEGKLIRIIKGG